MVRIQHEIYTENLEDHLVIYGWKPHYKVLIEELRGEGLQRRIPILIIHLDPAVPLEVVWSDVYVLPSVGDYEANLSAANLPKAKKLLISTNWGKSNGTQMSSTAILICILAKKIHPDLRVIVDMPFGNDVDHLLNSGVDEVLCGEEFCSMLMASTVINQGISPFFREILSTRYGNEFYLTRFSSAFYGKPFVQVLEELKEKQNALLMAIVRGKKIYTNPQFLSIEKDDMAIVLTEKKVDYL